MRLCAMVGGPEKLNFSPLTVRPGRRGCRQGSCGGFTILEVLVAIFIFVVALLGLVSVTTSVIHGNAYSKQVTTATNLAQDLMEDLKRKGYDHSDVSAGTHNDPGDPLSGIYTRTWSVVDNNPVTNIKTLTVTVAWSWRGAARNVQLVTYITKN
ncbi:MAG: prepilin-type N-terminal cleavage/methylation domain-containing protein [Syntrophobacterales bacterium]|nr:prepilin-type N-terminal cleavage/methylation domain-containing protein [Syntrophobacterales bacterium]